MKKNILSQIIQSRIFENSNTEKWEEKLNQSKLSLHKEFQFLLYIAASMLMTGVGMLFYQYGVYYLHYWAFGGLSLLELFLIFKLWKLTENDLSNQNNEFKTLYFSHLPEFTAVLLMSLQGYLLYLFPDWFFLSSWFHVFNSILFIVGAYIFFSKSLLVSGLANVMLFLSFNTHHTWNNFFEMYLPPDLLSIVIFNIFSLSLASISFVFNRFKSFNFIFFTSLLLCNYLFTFENYITENEIFVVVFSSLLAVQLYFSRIEKSPFFLYTGIVLFFLFSIYEIGLNINNLGTVNILILFILLTIGFYFLLKFAKSLIWGDRNEVD